MSADNQNLSGAAPSEQQATTKKRGRRGGRRRGKRSVILGRIQAKAHERQGAWAEGSQAGFTEALSLKLDSAFAELRAADREAYAQGEAEGTPYRGQTMKAGRG